MLIERRALLRGLFAMPAIVTVKSLMPIRGVPLPLGGSLTVEEITALSSRVDAYFRKVQISDLIHGLKKDGLWNKVDALWIKENLMEEDSDD